ncbi:Receptor-type tyrosine-protein phosphatase alpha [Lamellibrachia satsuma]|nr:Receptor-type tyrosine-protein phosphatase alpha [Lamellibrachia satsuma]
MAGCRYLVVHFLVLIFVSASITADRLNVAATNNNATCSASQPKAGSGATNDRSCGNATDGQEYSASSHWSFTGEPVGTWLITLTPEADDNQLWANFSISPPTVSRTINLTILSVYSTSKFNGLTEIRVYETLPEALTSALAPETTSQSTTTGAATAAATTTRAPTSGLSDTSTTTHHIAESSTHHIAESSTHHSAESSTIHSAELSTRQSTTGSPNTLNYIYIGAGAFVAFVVLLAVVIVLVCRRRRQSEKASDPEPTQHDHNNDLDALVVQPAAPASEMAVSDTIEDAEPQYANVSVEKPIRVSKLTDYFQRLYSTPNGFKKEFLGIPENPAKMERSRKVARVKNRYNNIMPYDHSRVILSPVEGDPDSDYINANYIDGYKKPNRFIATQGPNDQTAPDFWRMVWEQNSTRILMLTNIKERGKTKCSQYWPDDGAKTYGDIEVEYLRQDTWPDFVVRTFRLKKNGDERFVKQYHFTTWPDEGAPENGSGLLHFHQKVDCYNDEEDAPIIVHCSAGVGRTGTYIVLDMSLKRAAAEDVVDVCWSVHLMRLNRLNMVQTQEQYVFIYSTLVEALLFGGVSIACAAYKTKFQQLLSDEDGSGTKLARMYQALEIFKLPVEAVRCDDATTSENQPKNRSSEILPAEKNRPYLKSRGGEMTSDYINAVFVNGYRKKHAFIATQMPLPNTQVDFWRMVDDFDVVAIVMINPLTPGDETALPYWPEEVDSMEIGPFTLKKVNTTTTEYIKMTDIELTTADSNKKPATVRHFRLLDWPEDAAVPARSATILEMFAEIKRWKRQHNDGVVVTHCSHGVRRCGFLCALSITLDKIDLEQEVDVFNSVKSVRQCRPAFISNLVSDKLFVRVSDRHMAETNNCRYHVVAVVGSFPAKLWRHCYSHGTMYWGPSREQFEALYRFAGDYMDGLSVYANFQ